MNSRPHADTTSLRLAPIGTRSRRRPSRRPKTTDRRRRVGRTSRSRSNRSGSVLPPRRPPGAMVATGSIPWTRSHPPRILDLRGSERPPAVGHLVPAAGPGPGVGPVGKVVACPVAARAGEPGRSDSAPGRSRRGPLLRLERPTGNEAPPDRDERRLAPRRCIRPWSSKWDGSGLFLSCLARETGGGSAGATR
jgi:hypothetical protein